MGLRVKLCVENQCKRRPRKVNMEIWHILNFYFNPNSVKYKIQVASA